jgi:hypothetical protein
MCTTYTLLRLPFKNTAIHDVYRRSAPSFSVVNPGPGHGLTPGSRVGPHDLPKASASFRMNVPSTWRRSVARARPLDRGNRLEVMPCPFLKAALQSVDPAEAQFRGRIYGLRPRRGQIRMVQELEARSRPTSAIALPKVFSATQNQNRAKAS